MQKGSGFEAAKIVARSFCFADWFLLLALFFLKMLLVRKLALVSSAVERS
jgi:hypothetical protein